MNSIQNKYGGKWEEVLADVCDFMRLQRNENVQKYVGKRVKVELAGLLIDVLVKDAKVTFAGTFFQVSPLNGSKSIWVEKIIQ